MVIFDQKTANLGPFKMFNGQIWEKSGEALRLWSPKMVIFGQKRQFEQPKMFKNCQQRGKYLGAAQNVQK